MKTHQLDRLHQRTRHSNVDHSQQATFSVDECILLPLGICGPAFEKVYRSIEKLTKSQEKSKQIVEGDFNAELGPGCGVSVGPDTLKEENKRGDWMKHWLMFQNFAALNTMY